MVKAIDGMLKKVSIRKRIYLSFSLLVLLFVVNCLITIRTINRNNKLYEHVRTVIDPSLDGLDEFSEMVVASRMYSTNWVYLRKNEEDKIALRGIQTTGYNALRSDLAPLATRWKDKKWTDSLDRVFDDFKHLLASENKIVRSLKAFEDYDDPFIKLEAERIVDDEVIPQTNALLAKLDRIVVQIQGNEAEETTTLENYSRALVVLVTVLAGIIICLGVLLSHYMTKIIIGPIRVIFDIINDLGRGVIRKMNPSQNKDEIGRMVRSVNRLSESLMSTATFANAVGKRNFNIPFEPLSEEDTLGKALLAMRDDIKTGDEKLNEAQHIAHLGNWERDILADTLTMSDEMFNILELDPATFDGRFETFIPLIHPEDRGNFRAVGRGQLEHRQTIEYECRILTRSGTQKHLYIQSKILIDTDGGARTFGVAQDITSRKQAELQIIEREKQLRELSDRLLLATSAARLGIWDLNIVSEKLVWDDWMCRLHGLAPEEFAGNYNAWISSLHPDDRERAVEEVRLAMNEVKDFDTEFRIIWPDGTIRHIQSRAVVEQDDAGRVVRMIGTNRDITDQKTAAMEREKILGEIIQRNKSLEQFAYIVSHNLRAPVANILGLSNILNDDELDIGMDRMELVDGISESVRKLDEVIMDLNTILEVKQQVHEKKERIRLESLVEYINLTFGKYLNDEVAELRTDFSLAPEIITLKSYLFSVFYNLVSNSIKYRKQDTRLIVNITSHFEDNAVVLIFSDNGKGIDLGRDGENLFGLYKRFDTSVEGRGLGLFMVKTQVEALGGSITVTSHVDAGSTFAVRLPHILL